MSNDTHEVKNVKNVSDGQYTLTQTDIANLLYFCRNDAGPIGEVGRRTHELVRPYVEELVKDDPEFKDLMYILDIKPNQYGQVLEVRICPICTKRPDSYENFKDVEEESEEAKDCEMVPVKVSRKKKNKKKAGFWKRFWKRVWG